MNVTTPKSHATPRCYIGAKYSGDYFIDLAYNL